MTQRWKLTIEYDGSPYCGWQKQDNAPSVQQAMEEAIFKFCGEKVDMTVAGRTDTGVHAIGQVAHVDIERASKPKEIRDAINFHLGEHKISVLEALEVSPEFHARFDAKMRTYCYRILAERSAASPLHNPYLWHVKYNLDVDAMQKAANHLLGKHDFSSFRAAECQAKSPLRSIESINVQLKDNPFVPGEYIEIWVKAISFLHHQVRNMVGTLKDVGTGRITADEFKEILDACDRTKAGMTAPAEGLYFMKVEY